MKLGVKEYKFEPEELLLDIFPVVTSSGKLKEGEVILLGTPVAQGATGLEKVTAATLDKVVGISAEGTEDLPESDPVLVYYETGGFHGDRLELPEGVTLEALKPVLRKLSIFVR